MNYIQNAKRIVFKFGTNSLSDERGELNKERVASFIEDISELKKQGKEVLIVTSGAVGLGIKKLKLKEKPETLWLKQACAAIGQAKLMSIYEKEFKNYGLITAQILLTEDAFSQREKYLCLRNTLNSLLELGVVPVINQNDTVSTTELEEYKTNGKRICFNDNDKLSALVASKLDADLLVILSDIDGLYDKDPRKNKDAKIISVVKEVTPEVEKLGFEASNGGRGGMKTKIEAAKLVSMSGSATVIANGKTKNIIKKIFNKEKTGTMFLPTQNLSSKKRWIGFATSITGKIRINDGAKKALLEKNASLLPVGVVDIINEFEKGDVVSILDDCGFEIAKGMVNYSSKNAKKIIGKPSEEIEKILGFKNYDTLIIRDNIVIL